MFNTSIERNAGYLKGALDRARRSQLPMNVNYDRDHDGHKIQQDIGLAGQGLSYACSHVWALEQTEFELAFDAYRASIDLVRGTGTGDDQIGRARDLVEKAVSQKSPRQLDIPARCLEYLPDTVDLLRREDASNVVPGRIFSFLGFQLSRI